MNPLAAGEPIGALQATAQGCRYPCTGNPAIVALGGDSCGYRCYCGAASYTAARRFLAALGCASAFTKSNRSKTDRLSVFAITSMAFSVGLA